MIAKDKFGNEIYPRTFTQMCKYASLLKELGFREANTKPNLFYKPLGDGCAFADFRGFKRGDRRLPPWSDERDGKPRLYFNSNTDYHLKRNLIYNLIKSDVEIYKEVGGFWHYHYLFPHSTCQHGVRKECKACDYIYEKEFERKKYGSSCAICDGRLNLLEHHVSYEPEETVICCRRCHQKIHRSDGVLDFLKPDDERPSQTPKYKLVLCAGSKCKKGKKARVPIDADEDIDHYCHRCRRTQRRKGKMVFRGRGTFPRQPMYSRCKKPHPDFDLECSELQGHTGKHSVYDTSGGWRTW